MHRSTLLFACLSILLLILTAVVIEQLLNQPGDAPLPKDGQANVPLGIPVEPAEARDENLSAKSAIVWNTEVGSIVFEYNAYERRPIASITKLMTAMVAIDMGIDWDQEADIEPSEYLVGGKLMLQPGEWVTMRDLFNASLLGSANNATLAYVRAMGVEQAEFVRAMNRKAVELGLEQTKFYDVTGLDNNNVSTAYEVARMAQAAFEYPEIRQATSQQEYYFIIKRSGREHTIRNTNKLISGEGVDFAGSKTGYLDEAGYCLVVQGAGIKSGRIAVVLGSPSEPAHLQDIRRLIEIE